jgi:hypothetical protein
MKWKCILASAALAVAVAPTTTFADSISSVEGARAKERQGRWLNRQDREQIRRWGGNDDYRGYYYGGGPGYGYYGRSPGVGIYVVP